MASIIGLGNPLIDLIVDADEELLMRFSLTRGRFHPVDGTFVDLFLQHKTPLVSPGDATANVIVAFAQHAKGKVPVSYIGKVGLDSNAKYYEEELVKHGISAHLIPGELPTGRALTIVTPDGERTFAVDLGASVTLSKDDVLKYELDRVILEHDCFHFTGYQLGDPVMREALLFLLEKLGRNVMLSFDCADVSVVNEYGDLMRQIISRSDIVFANREEAVALFGGLSSESLVRELKRSVPIAVLKDGADGSYIYGDHLYKIPAFPVTALDTTGAGDMYAGSLLYGLLNGLDLKTAATRASFLASKVVAQKGARLAELPKDMP